MLDSFYQTLQQSSPAGVVVLSVALMLFGGFAMTRLTKLVRLPNVTAYILAGILMGPYCLDLIPDQIISGTDFLADIALAFIAFSVGEFFRFSTWRRNGLRVLVILLAEAVVSCALVYGLTRGLLGLPLPYCIVLSALAPATAPASMVVIIRQTGAKGDFVDTLLQVVALDNMVSLIAYGVAISVSLSAIRGGSLDLMGQVVTPVLINLGVLLLGGGFGLLMRLLMPGKRTRDNRLIIAVGVLFAFCGVCALGRVSPLLGCMSMGTVYLNVSGDDKLFKQLNYFSPPILLLFFVRSGLNFQLGALFSSASAVGSVSLLAIGLSYCAVRIAGKWAGSWVGSYLAGKPPKIRNWLGLGLMPQAGVAIGLAALCARTLGAPVGTNLQTVIMASSILYEIIGPAATKLGLYLSGSYSTRLEDLTDVAEQDTLGNRRPAVEVLIDRIHQIQQQLPEPVSEEETAFLEAEEEQYEPPGSPWRSRFWTRR